MARLKGKVAIITGASQGMGEAHARLMAAEGAKVILTDLNEKDGSAIAKDIGESALFVRHNVADMANWKEVVTKGEERFGTVNTLVNNAGIIGDAASTIEFTAEQYQKVYEVNELGVFLGMKTVLPSIIKAGGGSIINISSIAGLGAEKDSPNLAYVGTKFAVRGMTKQVAVEYAHENVRVNSVHPGYILTPMMVAATQGAEGGGEIAKIIPLNRMAEPSEVSNLIIFLASDESSYISGAEHVIDGALTCTA